MRQLLQLGRKRNLFKVSLHAATFGLLSAIITPSIAKTPPRYAGESPVRETATTMRAGSAAAQETDVTTVPPFVGTHSETWEEFPVEKFGDAEISILGGTATISGTRLETATLLMFSLCYVFAKPSDGTKFMGADSLDSITTISFSESVSAFGAYWGSLPDSCDGQPTILTFIDAEGNQVGTVSFGYSPPPDDGTLNWHGYSFDTAVKTITILGDYVVTDGMQAAVTIPRSVSNISTRGLVQTGDNVLIGGFIVTGADQKTVIIRGIGPSLGGANIAEPLADPTLELHSGSTIIASNDNWKDTQSAAIQATGIAPENDLESAIIATLDPGPYTAILAGKNAGTGVGLVEVYDLNPAADSNLANISTRGFVETGDNVMIGGFILRNAAEVLVRALGPSLAGDGVSNSLADPLLELHAQDGTVIASNDDWKETQQAEIEATGIPPTQDKESAVLQTLPPGSYTAIVRGVNDTTGNALVEVYQP